MSRKILGLDIRDSSLSAVLINGTLQGNHIEAFEYIDFFETDSDNSFGEDSEVKETEKKDLSDTPGELLSNMLLKLSEKMDISGCTCIASLPVTQVSFRNIHVPFNNEKKIKQVILFELEPLMPGSVDDLVVDFKIIDSVIVDGQTALVTASVKSGILESFEFCLKKGGFEAQAVLPGSGAAANYLIKSCDFHDNYLFADIDDKACTLFVIKDKQVVFIRSFAINTNNFNILGLNIKRTILSFCEQYDIDYNPEKIYVSGPLFQSPEALNGLFVDDGLEIELSDFRDSTGFLIENRHKEAWNSALFDNALALAYNAMFGIPGLRFNERFFAVGKYFTEYKKQIINAGILLLLVIIAGLANTVFDSYMVNKKLKSAREEMVAIYKETFPAAKVINNPYAQMKGKINEARKNSAFQDKSSGNIRVIDIMNEISKNLPDEFDIEFSRFVLGTEDLRISGNTDTYSTVDSMKKELEKIQFFKKVVISSTTNEKSGEGVKFKFNIEF